MRADGGETEESDAEEADEAEEGPEGGAVGTGAEDGGQGAPPGEELPGDTDRVRADLPGYVLSAADARLDVVYGDHIHQNNGAHLGGGVALDQLWQRRWRSVCQLVPRLYKLPKGKLGRRFVRTLSDEFRGVRERRWNSERPLVFAGVILRSAQDVRKAPDIRRRIVQRLDLWDAKRFDALVSDTEAEGRSVRQGERTEDEERDARAFQATVMDGRLREAVRHLTNRSGGGVLDPEDTCTKTGRPVVDVLRENHPAMRMPDSDGDARAIEARFTDAGLRRDSVEQRLDDFLGDEQLAQYTRNEIAGF